MGLENDAVASPEPVAIASPQPIAIASLQPIPVAKGTDITPIAPTIVADPYGAHTATAAADPAPAHSSLPMNEQQKEGAKCCGCCCDYRRAVIIVSAIALVLTLLGLLSAFADASTTPETGDVNSHDAEQFADETQTSNIILSVVGLAAAGCGLFGALKYNKMLVGVNVVWMFVSFIVSSFLSAQAWEDINANSETEDDVDPGFGSYVVGALFVCLWAYPSIGFIVELSSGIMSEETYPREEFSCCCTPNKRY